MVSVFTWRIGWMTEAVTGAPPASYAWESADRAVYYPLFLSAPCVARRVWWANGSDVAGGATIECGIYADAGYGPGAKLTSGSATQGSASQVQFVDATDVSLPTGLIWIALTASSATNTTLMGAGMWAEHSFRFDQATANPLPATATPVESTTGYTWLCGFSTTASP
jgi:hypothetical protein